MSRNQMDRLPKIQSWIHQRDSWLPPRNNWFSADGLVACRTSSGSIGHRRSAVGPSRARYTKKSWVTRHRACRAFGTLRYVKLVNPEVCQPPRRAACITSPPSTAWSMFTHPTLHSCMPLRASSSCHARRASACRGNEAHLRWSLKRRVPHMIPTRRTSRSPTARHHLRALGWSMA